MRTIITVFCLISFSRILYGDSPAPPQTYALASMEREMMFIMITDYGEEDAIEIHGKVYTKSGMYRINDEPELVWTSDYKDSVLLSKYGEYQVEPGGWANSFLENGIAFYKQGKLLKSYPINDLVFDEESVSLTVSHFFWRKDTKFFPDKNQYYLETVENNQYLFELIIDHKMRKYLNKE